MKWIYCFIIPCLFTSANIFGQTTYSIISRSIDTLTYKHRIGTERQDSIHLVNTGYTTLQPGGSYQSLAGYLGMDYLEGFNLFKQQTPRFKELKNYYAGLPHLGFFYSFGGRGLQNVNVEYQQTLAQKFNIHLNYNGSLINNQAGFLRNSAFKNNTIRLLMNYEGDRYKGLYYANYYFGQRSFPGGIISDSLLDVNPIQLIPVTNESASAKFNVAQAGTQHLYSFTKDSSLVKHGIVYQNELKIENRKYTEIGATLANYPINQFHLDSTYDHYQWSRVRNEAGYFIKSKVFSFAAKAFYQNWWYKTNDVRMDTTEIGVTGDLVLQLKNMKLTSFLDATLVGAVGEIHSLSKLRMDFKPFLLNAYLSFENRLPSVFMRRYEGNSVQWNITDPKLQQTIELGGTLDFKFKIPLKVGAKWSNYSNHYWMVNGQLRNDTMNVVSGLNVFAKSDIKLGTFHVDPYVALNLTSADVRHVPLFDGRLNLYWNKKLFSTKQFDFILGTTLRYQTKYDLISYNNLVDLYQFSNSGYSFQPILRMDVYTGFQIDNFRVFIRYENIDAFWNDRVNFTVDGMPIAPGVIRVGITWDFFN